MIDVFICGFAFVFFVGFSALLDIGCGDYYSQEEAFKDKAFRKYMKLKKRASQKEQKRLRNQRPTTF